MKQTRPRQLASDAAHDRLRGQILGGDLEPGDPLPSERALSEELGINRHAVREALKRLQQSGLVRISQGGATRVADWPNSAGLELLLGLMEAGEEPPADLVRSVLEMRASIGIDAARRCAERGEPALRAEVAEAAAEVAEAVAKAGDPPVEAYAALWQAIVGGSANTAYRLALNSLNGALAAHPDLGAALVPRDPRLLRELGAAIGDGHALAAAEGARALLEADLDRARVSRGRPRP